jgi:16S rRNA (adenine1518-N6/adenine1519-N6)-dimethyltransferase
MVKPKKHLGQHFLADKNIALKIVESLSEANKQVLEIGPGTGVLTQFLRSRSNIDFKVVEVDTESVEYLRVLYDDLQILHTDFLKLKLDDVFKGSIAIIGNFPYNISSQIFFKVLDYKDQVTEVVGMIQKEVAQRIASPPGSKQYGILSVLLQTYYDINYLFTVNEGVFIPPPKVKSAVIRLSRNERKELACNEKLLVRVVKQAFNQRRKTLRNSLKSILLNLAIEPEILTRRPEQLSVEEFIKLTQQIESQMTGS